MNNDLSLEFGVLKSRGVESEECGEIGKMGRVGRKITCNLTPETCYL